jgi:hypothetical protein
MFSFQEVDEVNEVQMPSTLSIQTPSQYQIHAFMWPQWCYINGCHICTNNMKFHFFTLMGFDVHHTGVPLIWIIINQQTIENLVEWLKPLKATMISHITNWRSFCFIIDNAS